MKNQDVVVRRSNSGHNDTVENQDFLEEEKKQNQIDIVATNEKIQENFCDDLEEGQPKHKENQLKQKGISLQLRKRKICTQQYAQDQSSPSEKNQNDLGISAKITGNSQYNDILESEKQSEQQLEPTGRQGNQGATGNKTMMSPYVISSDSDDSEYSISYENLQEEGLENKTFESNNPTSTNGSISDPKNVNALIARKRIYKARRKEANDRKSNEIYHNLKEIMEKSISNRKTSNKPDRLMDFRTKDWYQPCQKQSQEQQPQQQPQRQLQQQTGQSNNNSNNHYSYPWLLQGNAPNSQKIILKNQTRQQRFSNSINRGIEFMKMEEFDKQIKEMMLKHKVHLPIRKITNELNPILIQDKEEEEDMSIVEEKVQDDRDNYQKQKNLKKEPVRLMEEKIPKMPLNFKSKYAAMRNALIQSLVKSVFITSKEMGFEEFQKESEKQNLNFRPCQLVKPKQSAKAIRLLKNQRNIVGNSGVTGICINTNENKSIDSINEVPFKNEGNCNDLKNEYTLEEQQTLGDKSTIGKDTEKGRITTQNREFAQQKGRNDEFNNTIGVSQEENHKIEAKVKEEQVEVIAEEKRELKINHLKFQRRIEIIKKKWSFIGIKGQNNTFCLNDNQKRKEKNQQQLFSVEEEENQQVQKNQGLKEQGNSWKSMIVKSAERKVGRPKTGRSIVKTKNSNEKQSKDYINTTNDADAMQPQSTREEQNYQMQGKQSQEPQQPQEQKQSQ